MRVGGHGRQEEPEGQRGRAAGCGGWNLDRIGGLLSVGVYCCSAVSAPMAGRVPFGGNRY